MIQTINFRFIGYTCIQRNNYLYFLARQQIEIIMDPGKVYRLGEFSPNLYLMQSMLLYLSQLHPSIDTPSHNGTLDSPTSEALAGFQLLAGLPPSGELDKLTWKYLVNQFTLNANRQGQL